jgi:hypothetical protein
MKNSNPDEFCPHQRAAEKIASRKRDEELLASGEVSPGELARINGGKLRNVRYLGSSNRIQALAKRD